MTTPGKEFSARAGSPMIQRRQKDAVNLNNLDDWYEFHQAVLK